MNNELLSFLSRLTDVSFGYGSLDFFRPDTMEQEQVGYRVDGNGNSLMYGKDGSWKEEWFVIGRDDLGDPIIVDVRSPKMPVLSAPHGEGVWESFVISDSIKAFERIVLMLNKISEGRSHPDALEANPVSIEENELFIEEVSRKNPDSEIWYWENFLEQESDD